MKKWYTIVAIRDMEVINLCRKEQILDENENFSFLGTDEEPSDDVQMTCLKCGYTEMVPDYILDEMSRKKYHFKIKKAVYTLTCQKCFNESAIPSHYLKK